MNNIADVSIYENTEFGEIRIKIIDGNPWFLGKDVATSLGYSNYTDAMIKHCKKDGLAKCEVIDTLGRKREGVFISEGNLYRLIAHSKLPAADRFERWIFDEVLPSIRKTGGYVADEDLFIQTYFPSVTGAESVYLKQMMVEVKVANQKLAETTQQLTVVTEELNVARPKAEYYDIVMQCPNLLTTTEIAADYGLSPQALNQMLHDWGVQYKVNGTWVLYSKYKNKGYAQTVTNAIEHNGYSFATLHLKWTQRGRLFIYELMKKHGILPTVERMRRSS